MSASAGSLKNQILNASAPTLEVLLLLGDDSVYPSEKALSGRVLEHLFLMKLYLNVRFAHFLYAALRMNLQQ